MLWFAIRQMANFAFTKSLYNKLLVLFRPFQEAQPC